MRTFFVTLIVGAVIAAPHFAKAESTEFDAAKWAETQKKNNKQNLRGWEGITFYCFDGDTEVGRQICSMVNTNFEFLVATSKIKATTARNAFDHGYKMAFGLFALEVDVHATKDNGAVHADVIGSISYSNAIEQGRLSGPKAKPRTGELVVWDRSSIGYGGTQHELAISITAAVDQFLKQFITDYLLAQQ